jgi:hypothetical protein
MEDKITDDLEPIKSIAERVFPEEVAEIRTSKNRVWVNGKFFTSDSKKAEGWKPAPKQERTVWGTCPDCGQDILEMESYWPMQDKYVCVWNGCWKKYYEQGIGFHDCAGLDFGVALAV